MPPPKPARKANVIIPYQKTNHSQARNSRNQYPSTENHIETMRIKRSKLIGYRPVLNGVDKISDKERKRRKWPKKMLSDMPSSGLDFNRAADSDSAYQSDCRLEKDQLDIKNRDDRLSMPEIRLQLYGASKAESRRISTLNSELKKSWQDRNSDVSKIFRKVNFRCFFKILPYFLCVCARSNDFRPNKRSLMKGLPPNRKVKKNSAFILL